MKAIEQIYPGIPALVGHDAETKARATLRRQLLAWMAERYEAADGNPSRLLYDWLARLGADYDALERCGFSLLAEDDNLKGSDRIGSGPADFGNHWFDHTRILRQKEDGRLFVLAEPYTINNVGLLQLAEMARIGLSVWIDGASAWNPGRTMMILIGEKSETYGQKVVNRAIGTWEAIRDELGGNPSDLLDVAEYAEICKAVQSGALVSDAVRQTIEKRGK